MNLTYLLLNLAVLLPPLFLSLLIPRFHWRVKFSSIFMAILAGIVLKVPWDILFTRWGIWSFNPTYLLGVNLLSLPLEEWLFFITIPFASLFTFHMVSRFLPPLPPKYLRMLAMLVILASVILLNLGWGRIYTLTIALLVIALNFLLLRLWPQVFRHGFITFGLLLLPFIITNGVLTGGLGNGPVVTYHPATITNLRLYTIPLEDLFYAYALLFTNWAVFLAFTSPPPSNTPKPA